MIQKRIPKELQGRVRKYLEYIYNPEGGNLIKESSFFSMLSSSLREEIITFVHGNIINYFNFSLFNFSNVLILRLPFFLEESQYGPNEIIFLVLLITITYFTYIINLKF